MCTWKGYNEIYSKLSVLVPAMNKVKLVAAARLNNSPPPLDCKKFVMTEIMHRNVQLSSLKIFGKSVSITSNFYIKE